MRMSREHIEAMVRHARAEAPNEACGLLAGANGMVTAVHCLENADHSPSTYELTAAGYRLLMELDDNGQLLGVFHSHTQTEAYPSPTDRRKAFWPVYYVLVSLQNKAQPVVRAFRIVKGDPLDAEDLGQVIEERLEVV